MKDILLRLLERFQRFGNSLSRTFLLKTRRPGVWERRGLRVLKEMNYSLLTVNTGSLYPVWTVTCPRQSGTHVGVGSGILLF